MSQETTEEQNKGVDVFMDKNDIINITFLRPSDETEFLERAKIVDQKTKKILNDKKRRRLSGID